MGKGFVISTSKCPDWTHHRLEGTLPHPGCIQDIPTKTDREEFPLSQIVSNSKKCLEKVEITSRKNFLKCQSMLVEQIPATTISIIDELVHSNSMLLHSTRNTTYTKTQSKTKMHK